MPRTTTVGQLLVNSVLPEDLRDERRVLDGKALDALLSEVAQKYPDRYREISYRLNRLGRLFSFREGGLSFTIKDLRKSQSAQDLQKTLQQRIRKILHDPRLSPERKNEEIVRLTGEVMPKQAEMVFQEGLQKNNPLTLIASSGVRGNLWHVNSLLGGDLLYTDHRHRIIPIPVLHSYSEGLTPAEYMAGAFGARRGLTDLKLGTADAGYFSKLLTQAAHRLVVTAIDRDQNSEQVLGLPVDTDDPDNLGALLAHETGGYPAGTVITRDVLKKLSRSGIKRILIRSPILPGPPDGGVYAADVGIRESGKLPSLGELPGITGVQALSERVSQQTISSRHSGGVAGLSKTTSGFALLDRLVQVPKTFPGAAVHAQTDGTVEKIEASDLGGHYIWIGGQQHFVPSGLSLLVKPGDTVTAGDEISEGWPNPRELVRHLGVGEGRRRFVETFKKALIEAGVKPHRRNIELLAKGLLDHVRLKEEYKDYVPDEIVPYSLLERDWSPRPGSEELEPERAQGYYLEQPVLHYTIGTRLTPKVVNTLKEFGIKKIRGHREPPPFEPEMVRAMDNLQYDPDWMTRLFGSGIKKGLLSAGQRGSVSDASGTSFVPGLAKGLGFGTYGKVRSFSPPPSSQVKYTAPENIGDVPLLEDVSPQYKAATVALQNTGSGTGTGAIRTPVNKPKQQPPTGSAAVPSQRSVQRQIRESWRTPENQEKTWANLPQRALNTARAQLTLPASLAFSALTRAVPALIQPGVYTPPQAQPELWQNLQGQADDLLSATWNQASGGISRANEDLNRAQQWYAERMWEKSQLPNAGLFDKNLPYLQNFFQSVGEQAYLATLFKGSLGNLRVPSAISGFLGPASHVLNKSRVAAPALNIAKGYIFPETSPLGIVGDEAINMSIGWVAPGLNTLASGLWSWLGQAAPNAQQTASTPQNSQQTMPRTRPTAPIPPQAAPTPSQTAPVPSKTAPAPPQAMPGTRPAVPVPPKTAPAPPQTALVPPKTAPAPSQTATVSPQAAPASSQTTTVSPQAATAPPQVAPVPPKTAPAPSQTTTVSPQAAPIARAVPVVSTSQSSSAMQPTSTSTEQIGSQVPVGQTRNTTTQTSPVLSSTSADDATSGNQSEFNWNDLLSKLLPVFLFTNPQAFQNLLSQLGPLGLILIAMLQNPEQGFKEVQTLLGQIGQKS